MRTKQSWVWAIFLAVIVILMGLENNAEAQRRRPRVPANAQCTDSDNSPRDPNQAGRGEDRLTGGNTRYYSAQSRRYRTVTDSCNDQGQLVENYCDPVITYSYGRATTTCRDGESCVNGQCVVQCTDSDNSPRDPNQAGRGEDRLTGGNTRYYSAQSRGYRTVTDSCNNQGQLVENYCDPVITYSYGRAATACGEGEICRDGTCSVPTIVLSECGTPEGGWQNGRTYVLNQDIQWDRSETCFYFSRGLNITLDCQGHSITGTGENDEVATTGIAFFDMRNSKIQNCNISTFLSGLRVAGIESTEIINNTFSNNATSIIYEAGGLSEGSRFINNTSCNNNRHGVYCLHAILEGSGNHFNDVHCPTNGPAEEVYTPCDPM